MDRGLRVVTADCSRDLCAIKLSFSEENIYVIERALQCTVTDQPKKALSSSSSFIVGKRGPVVVFRRVDIAVSCTTYS